MTNASAVIPRAVCNLEEVKAFARQLHAIGSPWEGEAFGWPAEYSPQRPKKPVASKMPFTPADFWIGVSGVWFFSMMWEHGAQREPGEFLDDRGIVKPQ